jgi:predicted nucleic acid-binding protein
MKQALLMSGEGAPQAGEPPRQGMLDTNILVLRRWIDPAELPDEMAISAVTLAELSAGPHQVRPNGERDMYDEHEERPPHHRDVAARRE